MYPLVSLLTQALLESIQQIIAIVAPEISINGSSGSSGTGAINLSSFKSTRVPPQRTVQTTK